jgi:hypothetical protein
MQSVNGGWAGWEIAEMPIQIELKIIKILM